MGFIFVAVAILIAWASLIISAIRTGNKLFMYSFVLLTCIIPIAVIVLSVQQVNDGEIVVPSRFGIVDRENHFTAGTHIIAPWIVKDTIEVKVRDLHFVGSDALKGSSANGIHLDNIEVSISYKIDPQYAWALIVYLDDYESVIKTVIADSFQRILKNWAYTELSGDRFEINLQEEIDSTIAMRLIERGAPYDVAERLFTIGRLDHVSVELPKRIKEANENLKLSIIESKRQDEVNKMLSSASTGVAEFIRGLGLEPTDLSASEIAQIMHALAELDRTDTFDRLVDRETGVEWGVVIEQGSSSPINANPLQPRRTPRFITVPD